MGLSNEPLAGIVQAWGVFAAGILQLALLLDGVRRNGLALELRWPRMTDGVRRLVTLGIPGIIAGGVTQINIVIGTVIASMQNGAVSHLYYADRIYELPLAIVGIAIGVVLLPDVSRHSARRQSCRSHGQPEPLVRIRHAADRARRCRAGRRAHRHRARPVSSAAPSRRPTRRATAYALAIFALGLPSFVMIKVFSPAYFAREDTATPMRYAVLSLTANTHRLDRAVLPVPLAGPACRISASPWRQRWAAGSTPACFTSRW